MQCITRPTLFVPHPSVNFTTIVHILGYRHIAFQPLSIADLPNRTAITPMTVNLVNIQQLLVHPLPKTRSKHLCSISQGALVRLRCTLTQGQRKYYCRVKKSRQLIAQLLPAFLTHVLHTRFQAAHPRRVLHLCRQFFP